MYLLIEREGPRWGWTLYSAYHLPVDASPTEFSSREECLQAAAKARGGRADLPVVERVARTPVRPRAAERSKSVSR